MPYTWTDGTITSTTPIRAQHINELRWAVAADIGAPVGGWIDDPITQTTPIKAAHFTQLKTAIQTLWTVLNLGIVPAWSEGEPTIGSPIRASHLNDLRSWMNTYSTLAGGVGAPFPPPLGGVTYWGVDSAEFSTKPVPHPAGGSVPLYMWVTEPGNSGGRLPEFWARYLDAKPGVAALTASEIAYLHDSSSGRNCKIMPIYAGIDQGTLNQGYAGGVQDALRAIALADAIGVPDGTFIYGDIEAQWAANPAWIRGWAQTMWDSRFGGASALYANTYQNHPFLGQFCEAVAALELVKYTWIWAAGTGASCGTGHNFPPFDPGRPTCLPNNVIAWQYGFACYQVPQHEVFQVDLDLALPFAFARMW